MAGFGKKRKKDTVILPSPLIFLKFLLILSNKKKKSPGGN